MKKALFALAAIGFLAACGKEQIRPVQAQPSATTVEGTEKEAGKTKDWKYCETRNTNHELLANGETCKGKGDQCGRKDRCSTGLGFGQNPDEIIFENLSRQEFIDLWNTDEGMAYLLSKGVYVVEEE